MSAVARKGLKPSFIRSSSGQVETGQGLALGMVVAPLAGLAVMFGAADRVDADACFGISEGSSGWVCDDPAVTCGTQNNTVYHWEKEWFHSPTCCPHCYWTGNARCFTCA